LSVIPFHKTALALSYSILVDSRFFSVCNMSLMLFYAGRRSNNWSCRYFAKPVGAQRGERQVDICSNNAVNYTVPSWSDFRFVKFDVVLNVTDSDFWCRTLSQLMWFHSFGKFLHLFCFRCVKILVFLFLLTKKEFCFYMYFAQCRLQRCDCLTGVLWTGSARPAGSQGSVAGWDFRYAESSSLHRRGST